MPEDIAGGSYVPDYPTEIEQDEMDMGAFLDMLAREGARPRPPAGPLWNPLPPGDTRGPGPDWERDLHSPYLDPPEPIPGMSPYPGWRQAPIENRTMQGLDKNFLPQVPPQTARNQAILKIIEMRNAKQGQDFDAEGYEHMPPDKSPLAVAAGANDLDRPMTMDPTRDRYLAMVSMADNLGIKGTIPDKHVFPNKQPSAEEMVEAIFAGRRDPNVPPDVPLPQPSLPPGKTLNEMIEEGAFPLEEE